MTTPEKDKEGNNNNESDTPATPELTETEKKLVDAQAELSFDDVESTTPDEIADKTKEKAAGDVDKIKSDFTDAGINITDVPEAEAVIESATDAETTLGKKVDKIQNNTATPETEKTYTPREIENLENGSDTAVTGEHLTINTAKDSSITVEDDAKLTINEGRDNKITTHGSGTANIKSGLDNEVIVAEPKDEKEEEPKYSVGQEVSFRNESFDRYEPGTIKSVRIDDTGKKKYTIHNPENGRVFPTELNEEDFETPKEEEIQDNTTTPETEETPEGEMPVEIREAKEKRKEIYSAIEVGEESIQLLENSDRKSWLAKTISKIKKAINPKTGKYNIRERFDSSSLTGTAKAEEGTISKEEGIPSDDMISIILERAEKIKESAELPANELKKDLTKRGHYKKLDAADSIKQLVTEKIKEQEQASIRHFKQDGTLAVGMKKNGKGFTKNHKESLAGKIVTDISNDDYDINAELNQMVSNLDNTAAILSDNSDTYHDARYKENPKMSDEEYQTMQEERINREAIIAAGDYRGGENASATLDIDSARETLNGRLELVIPGISDEEEELDKKPTPEKPKPEDEEEKPTPEKPKPEDEEEITPKSEDDDEPKPEDEKEEEINIKGATDKYAEMISRGSKFFKGKNYDKDLDQAREEYETSLMHYLDKEVKEKLDGIDPFDPENPEHQQKFAEINEAVMDQREALGEAIKEIHESTAGRKFKNWWRKSAKLRMVAGLTLTGGAIVAGATGAGLPITAALLAGRVALSGVGTTLAVEGGYEYARTKYGKTKELTSKEVDKMSLSELEDAYAAHTINSSLKGLDRGQEASFSGGVNTEKTFIKPDDMSDANWDILSEKDKKKIEGIEKEYIKPKILLDADWDKLSENNKMLNPLISRNRIIKERKDIKMITDRLMVLKAEQFKADLDVKKETGESDSDIAYDVIMNSMDTSEKDADKKLEGRNAAILKSNKKKWTIAVASGLIMASVIGVRGFNNLPETPKPTTEDVPEATPIPEETPIVEDVPEATPIPEETPIVEDVPEAFDGAVTIEKGDNLWNIIKDQVKTQMGEEKWDALGEGQQTHLIDQFKDTVADNPGAFGLENPDNLEIGQQIDLSSLYEKGSELGTALESSATLTESQLENITANNDTLQDWVTDNPGKRLTSELVNEILSDDTVDSDIGAASEAVDGAAATAETATETSAEGAAKNITNSTSTTETMTDVADTSEASEVADGGDETVTETAPEAVEQAKELLPVNENWKELKKLRESTKYLTSRTLDRVTDMKVQDFVKGEILGSDGNPVDLQDHLSKMEGFNNNEAKSFVKNMKSFIEHVGKEVGNVDRNWTVGEFSQKTGLIGPDGPIASPSIGSGLDRFQEAGEQATESFKDKLTSADASLGEAPTDQLAELQASNADTVAQSQKVSANVNEVLNTKIPVEADMKDYLSIQEATNSIDEKTMEYLTDHLTLDDIIKNKEAVFKGDTINVKEILSRFEGMNDKQAKGLISGVKGLYKQLTGQGYPINTNMTLGEFSSKIDIIEK
ncbi:MAG: hypothetical protein ACNFW9_04360 [Candidatus Kerfeldbacteria bacterium]